MFGFFLGIVIVDHLLRYSLFLLGILTLILDDTDCPSPHANLLPESLLKIASAQGHEIEITRWEEDVMCLKP